MRSKFSKVIISLALILLPLIAGGQLAHANPGDVICSYAAVLNTASIGDDGTIYAANSSGLFAINPNCTLKWQYQTSVGSHVSPVIADDGTIYFSGKDSFYAVNPDGTLKWQQQTVKDALYNVPAIGGDGTVYVGDFQGIFYALNPSDGSIRWQYATGTMLSPVIGSDGTLYVVTTTGKSIFAINPNGTLKWQYTSSFNLDMSPAVGNDGTVYAGGFNDTASAFFALTPSGTLKWQYDILQGGRFQLFSAISIGSDGTVYYDLKATSSSAYSSSLYAMTPDGKMKWNYLIPTGFINSLAIGADATVYAYGVSGSTSVLQAINPTDGMMKWQTKLSTIPQVSAPAIAPDGTIYVSSQVVWQKLYAVQGDAPWTYTDYQNSMKGYADSPWPRFKQNNFNTGHRPKKPPGFVISLPDVSSCDKSFSIPITLDNPDSQSLRGIDLTITFDSSVISPKNLPEEAATLTGGILQNNYSLNYNKDVSGQIILSIYTNGTTVNTGGIIAYLNFDVKGAVGSTTKLNFAQSLVNSTQATTKAGSFTVIGCKISGNVIYYPPSTRYVPNAQIILDGTPVSPPDGNTDCGGNYTITASAGTHKVSASKSTDLGGISGLDAYDISMYMIGKKVFNCYQKIAADVNRDGMITSEDAGIIREYAVKNRSCMNNSTPCVEWVFIPYPITDCSGWPPITYPTERSGITIPPSATGQDFIGIRIGDVTGNWAPDSATCPATRSKRSRIETRDNATYTLTANPGFTCKVPILLNDSSEIRSLDITVEFDSSVLTAKSVTPSGILNGKGYAISTGLSVAGKVFASMSAGSVVTDKGEVVYISFTPSVTTQTDTILKLTQFDVNETALSGAFGTAVCVSQSSASDCNGDTKIGLEDAVYGLQCISGLRQNCTCNADLAKVIQVLRVLSGL